jgi:hypothetical protein
MPHQQTRYYLDTLLLATLVDEAGLIKQAQSGGISGVISSLISTVEDYVKDKIHKGSAISDVFNLLASPMLMALGGRFTILGILLEIAKYLGFEPSKILAEIGEGLKSAIVPGQPISPEQVDKVTDQVISADTPTEPPAGLQKMQQLSFREVQIYKIALLHVMAQTPMHKSVDIPAQLLRSFFGAKTVTASLLSRFLSWVVRTVLIAAGLMTGEALVEHLTGKSPSGEASSSSAAGMAPSAPSTVQQIFKANPEYADETLNVSGGWIENVPPAQIGQQIALWAQDIYPDLQGKDSFIQSSSLFQQVVHYIQQYNANNTTAVTFMPKNFTSRKQVVDLFIDDLAVKVQQMAKSLPKTDTSAPAPVTNL